MKINIPFYLDLKCLNKFSFCAFSLEAIILFQFLLLPQAITNLSLVFFLEFDEILGLLKPFHILANVYASGFLSSFMVRSALLLLPLDHVTAIHCELLDKMLQPH